MTEPNRVPSGNHIFSCIDGHTCGNPVRLVIGGAPARAQTARPPRPLPPRAAASTAHAAGGQIAWGPCLLGFVAGEVTLFLLSNIGLGVVPAIVGHYDLVEIDATNRDLRGRRLLR